MGLPGFLGENRQIRSSYSEVYLRPPRKMGFGGFLGGVGVVGSKITFERFDRFEKFFHEKLRKNLRLHTSDDEHCAVAMEKVLCDVHGKIKIKIPFFIRHFYSISNLGNIITQNDA